MPFDEGLKFERELFMQLVQTPESRALRHAFFAERAAAQDPRCAREHAGTQDRECRRHRRGHHGRRHRDEFPDAGFPVTILEMKQEALDKGVATIRKNYEASRSAASSRRKSSQQTWRC